MQASEWAGKILSSNFREKLAPFCQINREWRKMQREIYFTESMQSRSQMGKQNYEACAVVAEMATIQREETSPGKSGRKIG